MALSSAAARHGVVGEEARARDEAVRPRGRAGADRLRSQHGAAVDLDVHIQLRSTIHLRIFSIFSVIVGMWASPKTGVHGHEKRVVDQVATFSAGSAAPAGSCDRRRPAHRSNVGERDRWMCVHASTWTMTTPGSPLGPRRLRELRQHRVVHRSETMSCVST